MGRLRTDAGAAHVSAAGEKRGGRSEPDSLTGPRTALVHCVATAQLGGLPGLTSNTKQANFAALLAVLVGAGVIVAVAVVLLLLTVGCCACGRRCGPACAHAANCCCGCCCGPVRDPCSRSVDLASFDLLEVCVIALLCDRLAACRE